jgi:hypothetical protein
MNSTLVIGFTNKFYTLWSVQTEEHHSTFGPNAVYLKTGETTRYNYIKNVSFSLEEVKRLYPDLLIDKGLRGKTQSFEVKSKNDFSPEYLKGGKYSGRLLSEILSEDFDYIRFIYEEYRVLSEEQRTVVLQSSSWIDHQNKLKVESDQRRASISPWESGTKRIVLEKNFSEEKRVWISLENHNIVLNVDEVSRNWYNGYNYYLPVIDGKSKRVKEKELSYDLELISESWYDDILTQEFLIKNISK